MAILVKELIELLQKYEDPNEVVCWQYYTRFDFMMDDEEITTEQFRRAVDRFSKWDEWEDSRNALQSAISDVLAQDEGAENA